jgi:hypothetical protein
MEAANSSPAVGPDNFPGQRTLSTQAPTPVRPACNRPTLTKPVLPRRSSLIDQVPFVLINQRVGDFSAILRVISDDYDRNPHGR